MIGILAKLAKAAKVAQTAEAAIDLASNKLAPGVPAREPAVPAEFEQLLESGLPDPRRLLVAGDVEEIVGKAAPEFTLAAVEDCVACDYHCRDQAGTMLGLHLSAAQRWERIEEEVERRETFDDLGDEAFRGGRQIYVRAGETVFWIHTAGEVMVDMAVRAARRVLERLGE